MSRGSLPNRGKNIPNKSRHPETVEPNTSPDDKTLDLSKLKASADNKINSLPDMPILGSSNSAAKFNEERCQKHAQMGIQLCD